MEPSGCSCLLVGSRRPTQSSPLPASPRRRVVLPGIVPGTVLRTRASVVEWIHNSRQLPAFTEYTVLMRGGKRVPRHAADSGLGTLPCGLAATNACQRCPWMAVGGSGESATTKNACWRASLYAAVHNAWVSASATRGATHLTRAHDDVMRCCSFLEPFAVKVTPNRLLGLQLFFAPLEWSNSPTSSLSRLADSAVPASSAPSSTTAMVYIERECSSCSPSVSTQVCRRESVLSAAASGGATGLPPEALNFAQECLLESLEQKRLVPALQRWAAQLPTSIQERLLGTFISQPFMRAPHSVRTTSLQVTLVVERNTDVLGMQSPLCSPSHPADLLSTEEQQLVEVVTAAAPLIHEIEVLVWVQGTHNDPRGTASGEAALHRLYPTLSREVSLEDVRCETWQGRNDSAKGEAEPHELQHMQFAQTVWCWCHPLNKELSVHIPPYHAALCAVPFPWLAEARRRLPQSRHTSVYRTTSFPGLSSSAAAGNAAPAFPSACSQRLPWVPTFWRHPGALDACCSVLLSIILEGTTLPTMAMSAITQSDTPHRPESVEVHAPCVSAQSLVSDDADISAAAGQTILDGAVVALAREAERSVALSGKSEKVGHFSSGGALLLPTPLSASLTPRRVLISVREGDGAAAAVTTAFVREVLRSVRGQPVRLCFYECTSMMRASALGAQVAATLHHAQHVGQSFSVDTGVVDVDPLASSFVAYACVALQL
ncbi:hypothetical protein Q4I30_000096 [Leishmania utingensis]|uniref:Uncharacterized protein n=1 Tax=Leishmania utingensis TaxID=653362 RepID=A0AAW3B2M1_9TRYP